MTVLSSEGRRDGIAEDRDDGIVKRGLLCLVQGKQTGLIVALVLVCAYFAISQPFFATWGNATNIASSNSSVLILALGSTFVILLGQIDLSATAAAAASGVAMGLALENGAPTLLAILIPIAAGLGIGLINGALVAGARISFLVVTLGTMSILTSFALVLSEGHTISVFGYPGFDPVASFVNDDLGPIPILMVFDVFLIALASIALRYTSFGRSVFAIGSNVEAARLNGIQITRIVLSVYAIAGLAAGIASIVQVGRLTGASPAVDMTQLMTVIAAVLIGGTAFSGGEGGISGTVIGVVFLSVVQNGVTLSEVSSFWQGAINGSILIAAVGLGSLRGRGRKPGNRAGGTRKARAEL